MKDAGWSVDFVAGARAMHHIGASRRRTSPRVILERHRGMIHYYRKHHPLPAWLDPLAAAFIMLRARLMLLVNETRR
jgi:GT2 family glycosyltransferase